VEGAGAQATRVAGGARERAGGVAMAPGRAAGGGRAAATASGGWTVAARAGSPAQVGPAAHAGQEGAGCAAAA